MPNIAMNTPTPSALVRLHPPRRRRHHRPQRDVSLKGPGADFKERHLILNLDRVGLPCAGSMEEILSAIITLGKPNPSRHPFDNLSDTLVCLLLPIPPPPSDDAEIPGYGQTKCA
jgi:hypothetical protein